MKVLEGRLEKSEQSREKQEDIVKNLQEELKAVEKENDLCKEELRASFKTKQEEQKARLQE